MLIAGCAKPAPAPQPSPAGNAASKIGFVRMDELIKDHPLYGQLAGVERSIAALDLTETLPQAPTTGRDLSREDAELDRELQQAQERTKAFLDQKQHEYQQQESAAIAAALGAAGHAGAAAPIGRSAVPVAQAQVQAVAQQMDRDLRAYQNTLEAQDRAQAGALALSLSQRADREYRARADDLQQKESAFALDLASKDSAERLQYRTQLANLALDDAQRDDVRKKLADIDRREADQIAAMRNRDNQTLAALRSSLQTQTRREIAEGVAKIHGDMQAKLNAREGAARAQVRQEVVGSATVAVPAPAAMPPDMRAKIDALHREYQDKFDRDAKTTIEDFNKTRTDLKRRYDRLHGVDTVAQESARRQIASLQAQHDKLYSQIVDQIEREVKNIAQTRGISVVVSNPAGAADGVDLTSDAKKDIESLHE